MIRKENIYRLLCSCVISEGKSMKIIIVYCTLGNEDDLGSNVEFSSSMDMFYTDGSL